MINGTTIEIPLSINVSITYMNFIGYLLLFFVLRLLYKSFTSSNNQQSRHYNSKQSVSPQDFELHLLSLASIVIKADGAVHQNELHYVRQYFIQSYGEQRASQVFKVFNDVVKKRQLSIQHICSYLNIRTTTETRLQILHFLFSIAQADGAISPSELNILQQINASFKLSHRDFISIKAMFVKDKDNAYKILEIDKNATDSEIKKAYRTMVKKYHPDKLMDMDETYRKGAEEKFRKVQEAYETICKNRGIS